VSELTEITFSYKQADGFRTVPANGVVGGITTQGDFQLQFYVEARPLPDQVRQEIKDGKLGKSLEPTGPLTVVRDLQVGVLMSREQARGLAEMITRQLAEFDRSDKESYADASGA
jgi:hypothetical protein